jgi:hypothetical protein
VVSLALVSLCILEASASLLVSEEGISPGHSAEYVRTQSRNSSTEPDAMYYNPAGLSFLPNGGIYIMINSLNTYAQKKSSLDLWGYQGINASNNLSAPDGQVPIPLHVCLLSAGRHAVRFRLYF